MSFLPAQSTFAGPLVKILLLLHLIQRFSYGSPSPFFLMQNPASSILLLFLIFKLYKFFFNQLTIPFLLLASRSCSRAVASCYCRRPNALTKRKRVSGSSRTLFFFFPLPFTCTSRKRGNLTALISDHSGTIYCLPQPYTLPRPRVPCTRFPPSAKAWLLTATGRSGTCHSLFGND
ncbi:hypothetical protein F4820DRAFT_203163 [Hypoxylon rubiginosum]|uniref:Uncharacterized protein n=1 Tax=Hypoxylon rubiginosum TaxID=110542 RepID=A0ACB9Z6L3_9PEZI|nr:hypothetical protein F4820DRAFT_203163 [Hypoxylon rubiginosum]